MGVYVFYMCVEAVLIGVIKIQYLFLKDLKNW